MSFVFHLYGVLALLHAKTEREEEQTFDFKLNKKKNRILASTRVCMCVYCDDDDRDDWEYCTQRHPSLQHCATHNVHWGRLSINTFSDGMYEYFQQNLYKLLFKYREIQR